MVVLLPLRSASSIPATWWSCVELLFQVLFVLPLPNLVSGPSHIFRIKEPWRLENSSIFIETNTEENGRKIAVSVSVRELASGKAILPSVQSRTSRMAKIAKVEVRPAFSASKYVWIVLTWDDHSTACANNEVIHGLELI